MHAAAASLALLLALGLAAGCGGDDGGDSFVGVPWVLSAGVDVGAGGSAPTATFTDKAVGGSTGCNQFTAPYTVDGDAMEIGTVASTRMACPPPADAVERAYLAALGRVAAWHLDGSELDSGRRRPQRAAPVRGGVTAGRLGGDGVPSRRRRLEPAAGDEDHRQLRRRRLAHRLVRLQHLPDVVHARPGAASRSSSRQRPRRPAPSRRASWTRRLPISPSFRLLLSYRLDGASLSLLSVDGAIVASYTRPTQP